MEYLCSVHTVCKISVHLAIIRYIATFTSSMFGYIHIQINHLHDGFHMIYDECHLCRIKSKISSTLSFGTSSSQSTPYYWTYANSEGYFLVHASHLALLCIINMSLFGPIMHFLFVVRKPSALPSHILLYFIPFLHIVPACNHIVSNFGFPVPEKLLLPSPLCRYLSFVSGTSTSFLGVRCYAFGVYIPDTYADQL